MPEQQKYDGIYVMSDAVCSGAEMPLRQVSSTFQDALHPMRTHLMCVYLCVCAMCVLCKYMYPMHCVCLCVCLCVCVCVCVHASYVHASHVYLPYMCIHVCLLHV